MSRVMTVPVYRWELPENLQPLADTVRALAEGRIDVVLFTSAIQVYARAAWSHASWALEEPLRRPLWHVRGRIHRADHERNAASTCDLPVDLEPEHAKMGHLVRRRGEAGNDLLTKKQQVRIRMATSGTGGARTTGAVVRQPVHESLPARTDLGDSGLVDAASRSVHGGIPPGAREGHVPGTVQRSGVCAARSCARPCGDWESTRPSCSPICYRSSSRWGSTWNSPPHGGPVIHNPVRESLDVDRVR